MEYLHPAVGIGGCRLTWEAHYSRLFNEAMERAAKISEPSLVATYLEQAKHWLGPLERAALKPKIGADTTCAMKRSRQLQSVNWCITSNMLFTTWP